MLFSSRHGSDITYQPYLKGDVKTRLNFGKTITQRNLTFNLKMYRLNYGPPHTYRNWHHDVTRMRSYQGSGLRIGFMWRRQIL